MIDSDGFRLNVGIILINNQHKVFWAKRVGKNAWQFPQGGISDNETPVQTLFRELAEEIGLQEKDVEILGTTKDWLYYYLPKRYIRKDSLPLCIGQKQKWFLLRLVSSEDKLCLHRTNKPEFDYWRWVNYWYPLRQVVYFKRLVYRKALQELEPVFLKAKETSPK